LHRQFVPQPYSKQAVHELWCRGGYAKIAQETSAGCCSPGVSCCGSAPQDADRLARELGYTKEELQALPEGANMGLSCGNPAALAALKPGETVLDLGSGGGFDVFIAGRKVGANGRRHRRGHDAGDAGEGA
jgi:arsenite methyltransferase